MDQSRESSDQLPPLILNSISQLVDYQEEQERKRSTELNACCSKKQNHSRSSSSQNSSFFKMKKIYPSESHSIRVHCPYDHRHPIGSKTSIDDDDLSSIDINDDDFSSSSSPKKQSPSSQRRNFQTILHSQFFVLSCLMFVLLLVVICLSSLNSIGSSSESTQHRIKSSIINLLRFDKKLKQQQMIEDNNIGRGSVAALYQSLQDTLADAKLLSRAGNTLPESEDINNEINILSEAVKNRGDDQSNTNNIITESDCFKFIGSIEESGGFSFLGISYAIPPVGNLRWRRPVGLNGCRETNSPEHHHLHRLRKKVLDDDQDDDDNDVKERKKTLISAKSFGSPCFQVNPYNKEYSGSEDCLYLNVWTPSIDPQAKLNVMVSIHGGFLQFGSGNQEGLSPTAFLAKKLNTVFVSFNFRLHALGFLALEELVDDDLGDSHSENSTKHLHDPHYSRHAKGNYGLYDHVLVLEWIRDNIRAFGGDPERVTLFGPDSAGAAILALSSNPTTSKLFSKGWMMNPTIYFNRSFESTAKRMHDSFMSRTSCSTASCLRQLTPLQVTQYFLGHDDPSFRINDQNDLPIQGIFAQQLIVVDGDLVRFPFGSEGEADLPLRQHLLIGSTSESIEFWAGPSDLSSWSWDQYVKYVTTSFDSFGPSLSQLALNVYPFPGSSSDASPQNERIVISRDMKQSLVQTERSESTSPSPTTADNSIVINSEQKEEKNAKMSPKETSDNMRKERPEGQESTMTSSRHVSSSTLTSEAGSSFSSLETTTLSSSSESSPTVASGSKNKNIISHLMHDSVASSSSPSSTTASSTPSSSESTTISYSSTERMTRTTLSSSASIPGKVEPSGMIDKKKIRSEQKESERRKRSVNQEDSRREEDGIIITQMPTDDHDFEDRKTGKYDNNSIIEGSKKMSMSEEEEGVNSSLIFPELLYSKMVSDIRQVCPVTQLSHAIAKCSSKKNTISRRSQGDHDNHLERNAGRVYRYIVTSHPSSSVRFFFCFSKTSSSCCADSLFFFFLRIFSLFRYCTKSLLLISDKIE